MIDNWHSIPEGKRKTIEILAKNCQWKHIYSRHNEWLKASSKEGVKKICLWLKENNWNPAKEEEIDDSTFLHSKSYWYDSDREVYVLHLPSHKRPFVLRASVWGQMKEAYSNWDNAPASVNEMARKFGMARATVREVLRAMGHTHDGAIWTDDTITGSDEEALVEDLLQRKLQSVVTKAERKEWSRIKKDANKWRRADILAKEIERRFVMAMPYNIPVLTLPDPSSPYVALISPTDFHWGKYASSLTGDEYNRDIARERLMSTTEAVLSRCTGSSSRVICNTR